MPQRNHQYNTQTTEDITTFYCRTDIFNYSFFPRTIMEYSKLVTRLGLGLKHFNEHKFKHNFKDCINSLRTCSLEIECLSHFFLHCHYFTNAFKPL